MLLEYVGQQECPVRFNTPIPFVSEAEKCGVLEFNPTCDVPNDDWANFLLNECGDAFRLVEETKEPEIIKEEKKDRYLGKQFTGKAGKWNAIAYLKKKKLTETYGLKKLKEGERTLGWELCPIALADVSVGTPLAAIPADAEGQKELHGDGSGIDGESGPEESVGG